jgi:rRNA maturation endonuclease Nob1
MKKNEPETISRQFQTAGEENTMLGYVILFGLFLGASYWILNPLLRQEDRQNGLALKPEDILEELKNQKEGAYAAIRELEFDLSMGKLTEEDFQILKRQYTREAVGYMIEMDRLVASRATSPRTADSVPEQNFEQEVAEMRNLESSGRNYIYCTACGEKAAFENRFCAACGSSLHKNSKE